MMKIKKLLYRKLPIRLVVLLMNRKSRKPASTMTAAASGSDSNVLRLGGMTYQEQRTFAPFNQDCSGCKAGHHEVCLDDPETCACSSWGHRGTQRAPGVCRCGHANHLHKSDKDKCTAFSAKQIQCWCMQFSG